MKPTRRPLRTRLLLLLAAAAWLSAAALPSPAADMPPAKTRVLVVTGGHGFERAPFFQVFKDNPEISFRAVEHTNAHALLTPEAAVSYDVVVLYDMWQPIRPDAQTNFLNVLRAGKGLVATHHCLAGYQNWDEYRRIIGGRYYLQDTTVGGKLWKGSTYKHDQKLKVKVADPKHPVTRGVGDFEIEDETYGGFEVLADSKPLLTTDHPDNTATICWWRNYGPARVAYLQLGHDHKAFENPNYRKLLANAIRWAGGRD
jgi:type 1 glutamine amidotransferase